MRTTLELLEILRDKGKETAWKGLNDQVRALAFVDIITSKEMFSLQAYLSLNLPNALRMYAFETDTERYAWIDQQIEKLKQEGK